jgi:hypothetical protein
MHIAPETTGFGNIMDVSNKSMDLSKSMEASKRTPEKAWMQAKNDSKISGASKSFNAIERTPAKAWARAKECQQKHGRQQ